MVKIKISYDTDKELAKVLELLQPFVKLCRKSKNDKGKFKKAYVELKE